MTPRLAALVSKQLIRPAQKPAGCSRSWARRASCPPRRGFSPRRSMQASAGGAEASPAAQRKLEQRRRHDRSALARSQGEGARGRRRARRGGAVAHEAIAIGGRPTPRWPGRRVRRPRRGAPARRQSASTQSPRSSSTRALPAQGNLVSAERTRARLEQLRGPRADASPAPLAVCTCSASAAINVPRPARYVECSTARHIGRPGRRPSPPPHAIESLRARCHIRATVRQFAGRLQRPERRVREAGSRTRSGRTPVECRNSLRSGAGVEPSRGNTTGSLNVRCRLLAEADDERHFRPARRPLPATSV